MTLAAEIQGLVNFRKNSHVSGILLNSCSEKLYKMLKDLLERETGLPVLGFLPNLPQAAVESRHLGLKTAGEITDLQEKIALLADALVLDWAALAALTEKPAPEAFLLGTAPAVRIAVAKDEAFCFIYAETLDALAGCRGGACAFQPGAGCGLPENIGGLYLPGGYPELYARPLSENKTMRDAIRDAVQWRPAHGGRVRRLLSIWGRAWRTPTVRRGPWRASCRAQASGRAAGALFGYAVLTAKADSMLFRAGETLPIHEFHHWDSTANGTAFTARKTEKRQWECGFANAHLYAGFPHLYWAGTALPRRFVRAAERYSKTKG